MMLQSYVLGEITVTYPPYKRNKRVLSANSCAFQAEDRPKAVNDMREALRQRKACYLCSLILRESPVLSCTLLTCVKSYISGYAPMLTGAH